MGGYACWEEGIRIDMPEMTGIAQERDGFMTITTRSRIRTLVSWGLFLTLPCYLVDQWTKWLIYTHIGIGHGFTVIPGFFDIIHMRNTGAAFGMLQGLPATYRTLFFVSVTIIACVAIFYVFWQMEDTSWILKVVFSLILAGAIGNLTDRFVFNEVVDFLSFHIGRFRWPTFNMADTYISIGMGGLIIYSFLMPKKP
jgi:signal peptidase II